MKKRATKLWLEIACLTGILVTVMMFSAGTVHADLEGVKQNGVLRHLGIPYAGFITGAGDGMDVELMQRFAKHLGVRYEFLKTDWTDIFGDLTGNKVRPKGNDIEFVASVPIKGDVAANGITVLPWREKAVNFSLPTFPNQVWLVARSNSPIKPIKPSGNLDKDIATVKRLIKGKSLLGKTGTCLDPSLYNLQEVTNKIKLFPGSLNDMAPAIINGETELSLLDVPDALVALQKWPGKIKVIGPVSEVQDMAVAFSKDSPELLAEFNRFLDKSKNDGSFVQLAKKYYPFVANYYPKFFAR
ncbi:MAG: transporter substrate-binding domain-containing protein [Deltaproteobacteria bacterium]